jgi:hypothetical protein
MKSGSCHARLLIQRASGLACFKTMLPRLFSALSGCVWAGIVWILLDQRINVGIAGGILASPLIGLAMGSFSKRFRERPFLTRATIAFLSLYLAAALFGTVGGFADAAFGLGRSATVSLIIEWVWAFLMGLTFTGYFLILWPLAYLNHSLIGWTFCRRASANPDIASSRLR